MSDVIASGTFRGTGAGCSPNLLATSQSRIAELCVVKARWLRRLAGVPGVTAVGVGHRVRDRRATDEPVLRVYVRRKLSPAVLARRGFPDVTKISGLQGAVDVIEASAFARNRLHRGGNGSDQAPLRGGHEVAHGKYPEFSGTLGAVLKDVDTSEPRLFSAWHVMGAGLRGLEEGAPVISRSHGDKTVGHITYFGSGGRIDVAAAKPVDGLDLEIDALPNGRRLIGSRDIRSGRPGDSENLWKYGATTGWTTGYITDFDHSTSYVVGPENDRVLVSLHGCYLLGAHVDDDGGLLEISRGGDSGSIVVDDDRCAIGLLVSGDADGDSGDEYAVVCPIKPCLRAVGLEIG